MFFFILENPRNDRVTKKEISAGRDILDNHNILQVYTSMVIVIGTREG